MTDETYEIGYHPTRTVRIGQRVCVVGVGTANIFHSHGYTVKRVTKTVLILEDADGRERRFRREALRTIPYQPYGGWMADTTCQRKST